MNDYIQRKTIEKFCCSISATICSREGLNNSCVRNICRVIDPRPERKLKLCIATDFMNCWQAHKFFDVQFICYLYNFRTVLDCFLAIVDWLSH